MRQYPCTAPKTLLWILLHTGHTTCNESETSQVAQTIGPSIRFVLMANYPESLLPWWTKHWKKQLLRLEKTFWGLQKMTSRPIQLAQGPQWPCTLSASQFIQSCLLDGSHQMHFLDIYENRFKNSQKDYLPWCSWTQTFTQYQTNNPGQRIPELQTPSKTLLLQIMVPGQQFKAFGQDSPYITKVMILFLLVYSVAHRLQAGFGGILIRISKVTFYSQPVWIYLPLLD